MKILLAVENVFSSIGGGQRVYSNLIRAQPGIDFYYFASGPAEPAGRPANAHPLVIGDAYRRNAARFAGAAPEGKTYDLCYLLDMAAAASCLSFDVLDIPDYLPLGALLKECLAFHQARVGKVVLALHGTLSNVLADCWDERPFDLRVLMEYEALLYRYADLRYGISQRYLQEWQARCRLPALLLQPTLALAPAEPAAADKLDAAAAADDDDAGAARAAAPGGRPAPPDLCFVGRQEKCKGPDLFVEICSNLPRHSYAQIRLVGPTVNINGHRSEVALERLARNRSLTLQQESVAPDQMTAWLRRGRKVVLLPSRRDTFNLVVLEALLSGCPVVVSSACGVCDYLDQAYPGLPHVRLDPERLSASHDAIVDLLEHYDERRAQLRDYLARHPAVAAAGVDIAAVYGAEQPGSAETAARQAVANIFAAFQPLLIDGIAAAAAELARDCGARLDAFASDGAPPHWNGGYATQQFRAACRIGEAQRLFGVEGGLKPALDAVAAALPWLAEQVHGGNRVNLYRLMAGWEAQRGNELLFATYQLRIFRLSGRYPPAEVAEVARILRQHGHAEEARVLALIGDGDAGAVCAYLRQRAGADYRPAAVEFSASVDQRDAALPKVSVIVSVYNGADKAELFIANLERMSTRSKAIAELIFVDSNSPDDTASVLPARLALAARRGVRALYVRTPARETIQAAWNRGIELARGAYLAFLGLDEKVRGDAFEILADHLDRHPQTDWVQGNAVVTEVNPQGSYVRDVMLYDRAIEQQEMHYLDCACISYVGALYRKSIHSRFGYYDTRFRGAGDTEFKNRVLPFIQVASLPETLGIFLNYPEARTTQSPMAELEDLRAWYLFRTEGGLRYGLEARPAALAVRLFHSAMHYRKCYMDGWCSDVELALALGRYLAHSRPAEYARLEQLMPGLESLQLAYRRFDELAAPGDRQGLEQLYLQTGALERVWYWLDAARRSHRFFGAAAEYWIVNDNRWHQHHPLWPSLPQRHHLERAVDGAELLDWRDLGEVLGACGSASSEVDVEQAWATGRTGQLLQLMGQASLDVMVAVPEALARDGAVLARFERLAQAAGATLVLAGFDAGGLPRRVAGVFASGAIRSARPLYAAAKLLVFPWDGAQAAGAVAALLQALGHGKPVVLSRAMLAALKQRFPALPCDELPCAADDAELAAWCAELARDAGRRAVLRAYAISLARRLIGGGEVALAEPGPYAPPAALVEWRGGAAAAAAPPPSSSAVVRAPAPSAQRDAVRDGAGLRVLLESDLTARSVGRRRFAVSPDKLDALFKQLAPAQARGELGQAQWAFLFEPVCAMPRGEGLRFTRVMAMVWQARADLQQLYPLLDGGSRLEFVTWCLLAGSREYPALRVCLDGAAAAELERPLEGLAGGSEWDAALPRVLRLLRPWRPDLARLFDLGQAASRRDYLYWYLQCGRAELQLSQFELPDGLRGLIERALPLRDGDGGTHSISGMMQLEHQVRADLRQAFDLATAGGIEAYTAWHRQHGVRPLWRRDGAGAEAGMLRA